MLNVPNEPAHVRRPKLASVEAQLGQTTNSDKNQPGNNQQVLKPIYSGQIFGNPDAAAMPGSNPSQPTALQQYMKTKKPEQLNAVLRELDKPIRAAARKYGGSDDAIVLGQAKRLIADSIERYDPGKSSPNTFVDRQLQGLQRWASRRRRPLKTPDRVQLEASRLGQAERQLELELGFPPSAHQLADATGLPLSSIKRIRESERQVFVGSTAGGEDPGLSTMEDNAAKDDAKKTEAWIRFVRDDLNDVDQYILEHTLGMDGAKIYSNKVMAAKLKITPGALSQRKARIQSILDRQEAANPFGS